MGSCYSPWPRVLIDLTCQLERENGAVGSDVTPFKGRSASARVKTRLVRKFTKGSRVVEVRERTVSAFQAIEFIVFIDGSLLESQMFHGRRLSEYPSALEHRAKRFTDDSWVDLFDRP